MDIVRIILNGYGCEVARGIITKEDYKEMEKSDSLDNIWVKGLYKYLGKKWTRIEQQLYEYGLINGDVKVLVNDEEVIDLQSNLLDTLNGNMTSKEGWVYPRTNDVVMTTLQYQYGTIADVMFVINDEFDIRKLKFVEKEVHNDNNEVIINSLMSEIYYDDELIEFYGSSTDLTMSNIYFDKKDEHEKR